MSLMKMYDYLFYKIYKSFESAPSKWLSDWKASFFILVLELWICLSVLNYYSVIFQRALQSDTILIISSIILVALLSAIKFMKFEYQNRWKLIVKNFDNFPEHKNKIGTYVVWLCVGLIVVNLIFSFFLLSKSEFD